MGTNYYIKDRTDYCDHCDRGEKEIHLGKSSMGWHFSLHVYPDEDVNSFEDVLKMIGDRQIFDEYNQEISLDYFKRIVSERSTGREDKPYGYNSWLEFHRMNKSEEGLNGLIRARISSHCIGHGEGTWDYVIGEFC